MNNSGPTAQIVERGNQNGWQTTKDFVGHRKAITVVVCVNIIIIGTQSTHKVSFQRHPEAARATNTIAVLNVHLGCFICGRY